MTSKYIQLFPELNTRLVKFASGIYNWHVCGEVCLDNPDDVNRIHSMLKIIDGSPAFDFFDNMFNGSDPDTVCDIIGMSAETQKDKRDFYARYKVRVIKSYEDLRWLSNAVEWCIVISETSYDSFVNSGSRFVICENEGWEKVKCQPGEDFPIDNYGLSLLAVEVGCDENICSITTRWNDTGDEITKLYLKKLLGDKFNMLFNINDTNVK